MTSEHRVDPSSVTVAVSFTTPEEGGAVYGTILKLKHEGYFSSYSMYDNYALLFVPSSEADNVISAINKMADDRELVGIFAQID